MKKLATTDTTIEQFYTLIMQGVEAWTEAGKIVSKKMDEDPDWAEMVTNKHPEIGIETVYAFYRIGKGVLHPKLLLSDKPGIRALRRLPYFEQEKYLNNPVKVLIENKGDWESINMSIYNMTPLQSKQVFDGEEVRSEAGQRAWIESQKIRTKPVDVNEPYRVVGKNLVIMEPCRFTQKQLMQIMAGMD